MSENSYMEDDEITLKELILKIQEFWKELLRNWLLIILIATSFGIWFFYDAYITEKKYNAKLSFMINEDKAGGGGISALAGQFGFNVGGGGGEYNKEKIISLSKSGKIIHPVILDSLEIEGVNDLIGNHLIRIYNLHEYWKKSTNKDLKSFLFTTDSIQNLTKTANIVLKHCHNMIIGMEDFPALSSCLYDEDSGILFITSQSISEELAYGLTNNTFENLSTFYIKQQTEPQQRSFEAIRAKADSLNTVIRNKEYELATLRDGNNNVYLRQYKLREDRLKRELPAYASQYATLLQNVENADFILKSKTPFFQVIDYPFFPLSTIGVSKFKSVITGVIIGGLFAILFIIGRKIYRDAMIE